MSQNEIQEMKTGRKRKEKRNKYGNPCEMNEWAKVKAGPVFGSSNIWSSGRQMCGNCMVAWVSFRYGFESFQNMQPWSNLKRFTWYYLYLSLSAIPFRKENNKPLPWDKQQTHCLWALERSPDFTITKVGRWRTGLQLSARTNNNKSFVFSTWNCLCMIINTDYEDTQENNPAWDKKKTAGFAFSLNIHIWSFPWPQWDVFCSPGISCTFFTICICYHK